MKDRTHVAWLNRELPTLVTEGVLTAEAAERLKQHYAGMNRGSAVSVVSALYRGAGDMGGRPRCDPSPKGARIQFIASEENKNSSSRSRTVWFDLVRLAMRHCLVPTWPAIAGGKGSMLSSGIRSTAST